MKEIIGKQKQKSSSLPKAIKTKQENTKKKRNCKRIQQIFRQCRHYTCEQDSSSYRIALESKIPVVTKDLGEYLLQCNASIEHKELPFQELENEFKTLKLNKAIGSDGLSGNIIMDVYDSIKMILFKILRYLLKKQSFLKNLKQQKLFHFLKKVAKKILKTTDQFLFFQFFQSA